MKIFDITKAFTLNFSKKALFFLPISKTKRGHLNLLDSLVILVIGNFTFKI